METTALSDLWRDIETTEPNDRRKLAKELGLPDLQARVLVQDRQLSQAIEGDDWLLIQLELPEVKRRDVVLRNLTLLLGASQIVTIHAGALEAEITAAMTENKALAQKFKQDWQEEADKLESSLHSKFSATEIAFTQRITNLEKGLEKIEADMQNTNRQLDSRLTEFEAGLNTRLEKTAAKAAQSITALSQSADTKFAEYKKQATYYYEKFDKSIAGIDKLSAEMEKAQESVKDRLLQDFGKHTYTMQEKYNGFEKHFSERANALAGRLQEITEHLNVLREESQSALSEKLRLF